MRARAAEVARVRAAAVAAEAGRPALRVREVAAAPVAAAALLDAAAQAAPAARRAEAWVRPAARAGSATMASASTWEGARSVRPPPVVPAETAARRAARAEAAARRAAVAAPAARRAAARVRCAARATAACSATPASPASLSPTARRSAGSAAWAVAAVPAEAAARAGTRSRAARPPAAKSTRSIACRCSREFPPSRRPTRVFPFRRLACPRQPALACRRKGSAARRRVPKFRPARCALRSRGPSFSLQSGRPGTPSVTCLSSEREVTYIVLRSAPPKVQFDDSPVGTVPIIVPAEVKTSTPIPVPA